MFVNINGEFNIVISKVSSPDDGYYFEARIPELPDVIECGDSIGEVCRLVEDTIETTLSIYCATD